MLKTTIVTLIMAGLLVESRAAAVSSAADFPINAAHTFTDGAMTLSTGEDGVMTASMNIVNPVDEMVRMSSTGDGTQGVSQVLSLTSVPITFIAELTMGMASKTGQMVMTSNITTGVEITAKLNENGACQLSMAVTPKMDNMNMNINEFNPMATAVSKTPALFNRIIVSFTEFLIENLPEPLKSFLLTISDPDAFCKAILDTTSSLSSPYGSPAM